MKQKTFSLIETPFLIRANHRNHSKEKKEEETQQNEPTKSASVPNNASKLVSSIKSGHTDSEEGKDPPTDSISKVEDAEHDRNSRQSANLDPGQTQCWERTVQEEEEIQRELDKGIALIFNVTSIWDLHSELKEEFPQEHGLWNLPEIPILQMKKDHENVSPKPNVNNATTEKDHPKPNKISQDAKFPRIWDRKKESKNVDESELLKICIQLDNYINALLSIPRIVQSQALINFLSIPIENDSNNRKSKDRNFLGQNSIFQSKDTYGSSKDSSNVHKIFSFPVYKQKSDPQSTKREDLLQSLPLQEKSSFDYIFGIDVHQLVSNIEEQPTYEYNEEARFKNNGIINIPRWKSFCKTLNIPNNHCLFWRFLLLSGSGSTIDFSLQLLESDYDEEKESEEVTASSEVDSLVNNPSVSSTCIFQEKSCKTTSLLPQDVTPYQGFFHYENRDSVKGDKDDVSSSDKSDQYQHQANASICMNFQNVSPLFRSAQLVLTYQVVPYEIYQASCMAANEQNETFQRRKHAPLLTYILDSAEVVNMKVVPLFLDNIDEGEYSTNDEREDDNSVTNKKHYESPKQEVKNDEKKKEGKKDSTKPAFEEVLSSTWSDGEKSTLSSTHRENFHPDNKPNRLHKNSMCKTKSSNKVTPITQFSTHNLKVITKPFQNQIKMLRHELHQVVRQFDKAQRQNKLKSQHLQEAQCLIRELQKEKKQWKNAQLELENTMKNLMVNLNDMKEKHLSNKEFRDRIAELEQVNKQLSGSLSQERTSNKLELEKIEERLTKERDESREMLAAAEMDADDAKMMKTVLEGKLREMEKVNKEAERQIRELILEKEMQAQNEYNTYDVPLNPIIIPDYITMSYHHPNPELNIQLKRLQNRYVKLFHMLHKDSENEHEHDMFNMNKEKEENQNGNKKNERLLQKIGMAIQQIILSGDSELSNKNLATNA